MINLQYWTTFKITIGMGKFKKDLRNRNHNSTNTFIFFNVITKPVEVLDLVLQKSFDKVTPKKSLKFEHI